MPALDYYREEAVVKLIEGDWKWQDRFTLGKQLERIAADLITKQRDRYHRAHPWEEDPEFESSSENDGSTASATEEQQFACKKPEFIELMDPERIPDAIDDDGQEELDETYELVMSVVKDDVELEKTNEAYALAKISGLKYCEFLNRQYGTDYISVMPTNLYGPNDNYHPEHSHVLPALIRRFHEAKVSGARDVTC